MRYIRMTVLAAVAAGAMIGSAAAEATASTSGGQISIFAPLTSGSRAPALVTGAIGDHGAFVSVNRKGRPDRNGDYAKLVLASGSFELDGRQLLSALRPVGGPYPASCSIVLAGSAKVLVFNGTGAYRQISGTLSATSRAGLLGKRFTGGPHKGQCEEGPNAPTVALLGWIDLTGTVSLS